MKMRLRPLLFPLIVVVMTLFLMEPTLPLEVRVRPSPNNMQDVSEVQMLTPPRQTTT